MLKALIISADTESVSAATKALETFCPNISVSGVSGEMQESISLITQVQPDLLIVDTRLSNGSGFELLKLLDATSFKIIFISNHIEYALMAFKVNAVDFLLKPLDVSELAHAAGKAADMIGSEEAIKNAALAGNMASMVKKEKLILKTTEHIHIINKEEIIRIEADGNYCSFFIADGRKVFVSRSIKDYEDMLTGGSFYRIHKSHIINISLARYFDRAEGGYVVMSDGASIPVSFRKKDFVLELLDSLG